MGELIDQINDQIGEYVELYGHEPQETFQDIKTLLNFGGTVRCFEERLITCKDCKHATLTTNGHCKYCDKIGSVDEWGDVDRELYVDDGFFCGFAEMKVSE